MKRDRRKFRRELVEDGEGILGGNELSVMGSDQVESVKLCVCSGGTVQFLLSEVGSMGVA